MPNSSWQRFAMFKTLKPTALDVFNTASCVVSLVFLGSPFHKNVIVQKGYTFGRYTCSISDRDSVCVLKDRLP